jgi:uncharacterized damage-inducible protein DinB
MDRAAIEELFAYTDFCWREHEEMIRGLGGDALAKAAPGSGWPALRDALAHLNFAYDRWLASPSGTTAADVETVGSWDELDGYRRRVRGRCREYLDSLSDAELTAVRPMNIDGGTMSYSPADILVHVLLHERQHHGDISTLLYQMGVEAPFVDYRAFALEGPAQGFDRAAIDELYAFTDHTWRTYAVTIGALGSDALARPAPGSGWPTLRDAFGHMLLAYDDWTSDLTGTPMRGLDVEAVRAWDDLESYREQVRGRFREYIDSLSDAELTTRRPMNVDDEMLSYSPADILANLLLHERGHHGDVNTLLYQHGVEAPMVEYRFSLPTTPR